MRKQLANMCYAGTRRAISHIARCNLRFAVIVPLVVCLISKESLA